MCNWWRWETCLCEYRFTQTARIRVRWPWMPSCKHPLGQREASTSFCLQWQSGISCKYPCVALTSFFSNSLSSLLFPNQNRPNCELMWYKFSESSAVLPMNQVTMELFCSCFYSSGMPSRPAETIESCSGGAFANDFALNERGVQTSVSGSARSLISLPLAFFQNR